MNICLKQNGLFPTFFTLLMLFFLFLVSCGGGGDGDATVPPTALDRAIELKGEDESAGSCSDTIMQEFALNEVDCLSILNAAGYSSIEIGEMLRDRYGYDGDKAAKLLDDANFDLNSMNIVMKTVYNLNPIQVESVMENTLQYSQEEYLGITAREYIEKFSPILKFDKAANTFPMDAQKWFDEMLCGDSGGPALDANSKYDYISCQKQNVGWGNGLLSYLADGSSVVSTLAEYNYQVPTYYKVRRCGSNGQIRIQYWWFYGYQQNSILDILGESDHPADWEHIMLTLSEDRQSVAAVTYYQHSGWYTKIVGAGSANFPVENGRPIAFVGKTAHGSYHNSGGDGTVLYYGDWRNPSTTSVWNTSNTPLLNLDVDAQEWMEYDRVADWKWGFDAVGTHPTVALLDFCAIKACRSRDVSLKNRGCWDGYSDCKTGDTYCGTFVCAESSLGCLIDGYNKDYVIPTSNNGITAH